MKHFRIVDDVGLSIPEVQFGPNRVFRRMRSLGVKQLPIELGWRIKRDHDSEGITIAIVKSIYGIQLTERNLKYVLVLSIILANFQFTKVVHISLGPRITERNSEFSRESLPYKIDCQTQILGIIFVGRDGLKRHKRFWLHNKTEMKL